MKLHTRCKLFSRVLLFLLVSTVGCDSSKNLSTIWIHKLSGEKLSVKVEMADTPRERERGLMFRKKLPANQGMLFVFPSKNQTPFWMKNTSLSLDLIFFSEGRLVDLIENAKPYSEDLLISSEPYDLVLEVNGGFANQQKLEKGDTISLPSLP